jgi:hypothetical protein
VAKHEKRPLAIITPETVFSVERYSAEAALATLKAAAPAK